MQPNDTDRNDQETAAGAASTRATSLTIDLDTVAHLLGMAPRTLQNKRRALERDHGFPRPLPGCGLVWSAYQVRMWIDTNGGAAAPAEAADPIAAARAALEARIEGRAA